jgi:hypothetical protein
VSAKETPSQRAPRAVPKDQTALTGDVPTGPVAVPSKKTAVSAAACKASLASIASSASAFGQAITLSWPRFRADQTLHRGRAQIRFFGASHTYLMSVN